MQQIEKWSVKVVFFHERPWRFHHTPIFFYERP